MAWPHTCAAWLLLLCALLHGHSRAHGAEDVSGDGTVGDPVPVINEAQELPDDRVRVVQPTHGVSHGVTWLVQLSDLHMNSHGHRSRETDLVRFASRYVARLKPAAVVVTGDLTDSKTADNLSCFQYIAEWESVDRIAAALRNAGNLEPHALLALRGNHDTFDVPARGGPGDLYGHHVTAWSGWRSNATERVSAVLVSPPPGRGPAVSLLAVDATLEPGVKRPCNFVGDFTTDVEHQLRRLAGVLPLESVRLAATHYPTTLLRRGGQIRSVLGDELGVTAVMNGHLHWRLGTRLHALHAVGGSNRLAEIELGDWKQSRAWRVLAVDAGSGSPQAPVVSFRDFRYNATAPASMVVLITSPPDGRYLTTPLPDHPGGRPTGAARAVVRALVVPPTGVTPGSMVVTATAVCGGVDMASVALAPAGGDAEALSTAIWTSPAHPSGGPFSGSPFPLEAFAARCSAGLQLRVTATCRGAPACSDADVRPLVFDPRAAPLVMNNTFAEQVALSHDANTLAIVAMALALGLYAAVTVIMPLSLRMHGPANKSWLMAPFRSVAARPRLLVAHACYVCYLCIGPWAAAELLSNTHHPEDGTPTVGALSAAALWVPPRPGHHAAGLVFGMDAVFMTGPQMLFVTGPAAVLVMCALAALDSSPRRPLVVALLCNAGAAVTALWLRGCYELRRSYGTIAVLLSPGMAWVVPLAALALAAGMAGGPAVGKVKKS